MPHEVSLSDPVLLAGIAVAHSHAGAFFESVEVDSYAEWRADLVLAAIALADVAVVVEFDGFELSFQECDRSRGPF